MLYLRYRDGTVRARTWGDSERMLLRKLHKYGRGVGITLPKDALRDLGVQNGDYLVLTSDHDGKLTLEALARYFRRRDQSASPPAAGGSQ